MGSINQTGGVVLTTSPALLAAWTWRESNPRPNGEAIRFLHVYSGFGFRISASPGRLTGTLSSKFSSDVRGYARLFPIYLRR